MKTNLTSNLKNQAVQFIGRAQAEKPECGQ